MGLPEINNNFVIVVAAERHYQNTRTLVVQSLHGGDIFGSGRNVSHLFAGPDDRPTKRFAPTVPDVQIR